MERYSKLVPIRMPGEKKTHVKLSITVNSSTSCVSQSKDILIQLTKEDNPLFFYTFRMTEEDFRQFKLQQDLKVDFSNFPQMVIDLLEAVLVDGSKFYLWFDDHGYSSTNNMAQGTHRNVGLLKIIQSAGHKDLTHLALKLSPADSKQIQLHLSDTILHLKRRQCILEKQVRQMECDHKRQCQHLEDIVAKKEEELRALERDHAAALDQLNEETERQKQEMRNTLEHGRVELEETCIRLQEENRALQERLRGSNVDIGTVREEFQRLSEEVEDMRQRLEDCKREAKELEKVNNELQTRLESEDEDVDSKEAELDLMKDRYQALLDQKRKLDHSLQEWTSRATKFEDLYKVQCKETEKAVQIMHKCMNYSNSVKDKGTRADQIVRKQQELLAAKDGVMAKIREENERMVKDMDQLKQENKNMITTSNELRQQAQDQSAALLEKESVIANLSKQLHEFRLLVNPGAIIGPVPMVQNGGSRLLPPFCPNTSATPQMNMVAGNSSKMPFLHPKYSAGTSSN